MLLDSELEVKCAYRDISNMYNITVAEEKSVEQKSRRFCIVNSRSCFSL